MMRTLIFSPSPYSLSPTTRLFSLLPITKLPIPSLLLVPHSSEPYSFAHLSSSPKSHHRTQLHSSIPKSFTGDFFSPTTDGIPSLDSEEDKWDSSKYEALLKGGEQVTSVLEEMIKLLEDMEMDEASEAAAVELAAQGVIGKRVDEMESGFMMALDYMIKIAGDDNDDQVADEMLH